MQTYNKWLLHFFIFLLQTLGLHIHQIYRYLWGFFFLFFLVNHHFNDNRTEIFIDQQLPLVVISGINWVSRKLIITEHLQNIQILF